MNDPALLALAFFATALLYSSVGFGGGSTYAALLILAGLALPDVPVVALACNIAVVTIGCWQFRGAFSTARFWPLALFSIPAAWLGGRLDVPGWLFVGLLAAALGVSGLLLLRVPRSVPAHHGPPGRLADLASGAGLGLLAGITGIGGGIYLAPLLHLRGWAGARTIAATCAAFILVNSLAGLAGHAARLGAQRLGATLAAHWALFPAVLLGGWIGSRSGARLLPPAAIRWLTALLVLYVAARLGLRFPAEWAAR